MTARAAATYRQETRPHDAPNGNRYGHGMSRLDEAQQRLNAALTRLERVVDAKIKAAEQDGPAGVDPQQLDALKAENEQLRQASADAGERLDTAIHRLEGVLAE
ncbi:hypothetical protein [Rhodovibrio salinarum]|uniref:hypothetical protein n=1 Tax=Rhodovibrio salinarum TaxID=1087 RepID=UPI0004BB247B|nr:hypothetical protein [Rhodovibrio salinarum]